MKRLLLFFFLFFTVPSWCCTSIIISGKKTVDGRPLMLKHRDSDELNCRVEYFNGEKYSFIGLVNSSSPGGEVWIGTNEAGFSLMNTASYNIKDDDVPVSLMDREGKLMYRALEICSCAGDFEFYLDTLSRPMGVEANFGVIDAYGGAVYYEVNNHSWIKYDVNDYPEGYRVVTNFSESGRPEDRLGVERWLTATDIFSEILDEKGKVNISHKDIYNSVSRSYRHKVLGVDYLTDYDKLVRRKAINGIIVDQDLIPRRSTSGSVVIEGVRNGENPLHTVMWTILGYPACSVGFPLLVGHEDTLPSYIKASGEDNYSPMCSAALKIKNERIYSLNISNGERYLHLDEIVKGREGSAPLLESVKKVEAAIDSLFYSIFEPWRMGLLSDEVFFNEYSNISDSFWNEYLIVLFAKND